MAGESWLARQPGSISMPIYIAVMALAVGITLYAGGSLMEAVKDRPGEY